MIITKIIKIYDAKSEGYGGYKKAYLSDGRVITYHRFLMEQKLGRKLNIDEIVHHKDGNKQNNDIENLEIVWRAKHPNRHAKGRTYVEIVCGYCGAIIKKEARQVKPKLKKGQNTFYCDKKCMSNAFKKQKS